MSERRRGGLYHQQYQFMGLTKSQFHSCRYLGLENSKSYWLDKIYAQA